MKILAGLDELAHSDSLLTHCETAYGFQRDQFSTLQQTLILVDNACAQIRSAMRHSESEVHVLRRRMADTGAEAAARIAVTKRDPRRGDALRALAGKAHHAREAEARPFEERQREWSSAIDAWHDLGHRKQMDAIVYHENRELFARVSELMTDEHVQRERHAHYMHAASTAEADRIREGLEAQIAALSHRHAELLAQRADFGSALGTALTSFLRDGLGKQAGLYRDARPLEPSVL